MRPERIAYLALAAFGGVLLAVIVGLFWRSPNDSLAYWLAGERLAAGEPIFVGTDRAFAPYAYHYAPPLAQFLAPLTLVIPTIGYLTAYRVVLLLATWQLAGRRFLLDEISFGDPSELIVAALGSLAVDGPVAAQPPVLATVAVGG